MTNDLNKKTVTNEQEEAYVAKKGIRCLNPDCDNEDLNGGPVEINGDTAFQNVTCVECDWSWTDIYKLAGVDRDNIYSDE